MSLLILSVGLCASGAEILVARRALRVGVYSEQVLSAFIPIGRGLRVYPAIAMRYPYSLALPVTQIVSTLLALAFTPTRPWFIALVLGSHLLRLRCSPIGLGGFDQMTTIVLVGLVIYFAAPGTFAGRAGLAFIAAESALAYFVSGIAKLMSPVWRGGQATAGILTTRSFGNRRIGLYLRGHPKFARLADWATIGFEMLFPLGIVIGGLPLVCALGLGLGFHLAVGLSMGLNDFIWSFPATYPAIYYVSYLLVGQGLGR